MDKSVKVICQGESRIYDILETIIFTEQKDEYVYLYVNNAMYGDMFYQFKFEEDCFLVGDIFKKNGEHIKEFASHVFGEV